jgi:hypothetical protein
LWGVGRVGRGACVVGRGSWGVRGVGSGEKRRKGGEKKGRQGWALPPWVVGEGLRSGITWPWRRRVP